MGGKRTCRKRGICWGEGVRQASAISRKKKLLYLTKKEKNQFFNSLEKKGRSESGVVKEKRGDVILHHITGGGKKKRGEGGRAGSVRNYGRWKKKHFDIDSGEWKGGPTSLAVFTQQGKKGGGESTGGGKN